MKGRYKPGESGNIKGRPVGSINRVAKPIKEKVSDFLNIAIDEMPEIWKKLKPREKATLIRDLLPFVLAKLQAVAMTGEINFQAFTEDQLDQIASRLLTNNTNNEKK